MIYVKGTKWVFKEKEKNVYEVKPVGKGQGLKPFTYRPQKNFSCSKLKKHIRKRLSKENKND